MKNARWTLKLHRNQSLIFEILEGGVYVEPCNISQLFQNLKMLMETVFPNMYPDVNFDHAHKLGKFIRIAYINEQPIGLIICRMEKEMLYIALIGVLVKNRR